MGIRTRLLSVFLALTAVFSFCGAASAESGSEFDTAADFLTTEINLFSMLKEIPTPEQFIEAYNKNFNTDSYKIIPLTPFDIQQGMIASITTDQPELPDADFYVFPTHGMSLSQYAKQEARYHRSDVNVYGGIVPTTWYYISSQVYNNTPYIAYTSIQKGENDTFAEVIEFYKTKTYNLGNTSHTVELPVGCKEIPLSSELSDLGVKQAFRTGSALPFSRYNSEPESIHMCSVPMPEGMNFEDLLLELFDAANVTAEEPVLYHISFVKVTGEYKEDKDLTFVAYLFEENKRIEGIVFNYRNCKPNGFDAAVMDYIDYR